MKTTSHRLRLFAFISVLFSVLLQLTSLAAPGWIIWIDDSVEQQRSVFYMKECKNGACEIKTFYHDYREDIDDIFKEHADPDVRIRPSAEIRVLSRTYNYSTVVINQVYLVVITAMTMMVLVFQIMKLRKKDTKYILMSIAGTACLTAAAGMMSIVLVSHFVYIDYRLKYSDLDQTNYIRFPYCILLYTVAFLANIAAVLLNITEINRQLQHQPEIRDSIALEENDTTFSESPRVPTQALNMQVQQPSKTKTYSPEIEYSTRKDASLQPTQVVYQILTRPAPRPSTQGHTNKTFQL